MSIIATAAVPPHSRLYDADTGPLTVPEPDTDAVPALTDGEASAYWRGYAAANIDLTALREKVDEEAWRLAVRISNALTDEAVAEDWRTETRATLHRWTQEMDDIACLIGGEHLLAMYRELDDEQQALFLARVRATMQAQVDRDGLQ